MRRPARYWASHCGTCTCCSKWWASGKYKNGRRAATSSIPLTLEVNHLIDSVTVPAGNAFLGAEDALAAYTEAALALSDPARDVMEPLLEAAERAGHLPAQARASLVLAGADRQAGEVRETPTDDSCRRGMPPLRAA